MGEPVDLLLITCNRREYTKKTLSTLLADSADFRLYWWDNASRDGTQDLVAEIKDPRIVKTHLSKENVNQRAPFWWCLENSRSDLMGKVDDDVLLPVGWTERFAPLIRAEPRFGILACWVFMPEDWDESVAAHNIVEVGGTRLLRLTTTAGCAFLSRKSYLHKYGLKGHTYGIPIDRLLMCADGLVNGCPLPLMFAHHMDDPRSPHNMFIQSGQWRSNFRALTARTIGFETPTLYVQWIRDDARHRLTVPYAEQLREAMKRRHINVFQKLGCRMRAAVRKGIDLVRSTHLWLSSAVGSNPRAHE